MRAVKIYVQGNSESGKEFGDRLTNIIKLLKGKGCTLNISFTSDSDGRQTANIIISHNFEDLDLSDI